MIGRRTAASGIDADRRTRSEPFEVFTRPQRSLPARILGLALRLRAELLIGVTALWMWSWLSDRMPAWLGLVLVGVGVLAVVLIGPSRRYVTRRGFAVLTRHRLRAVFVQRRVMNWTGNLPILLWSRPTPVGERVWVLLRAGIDLVDVERNLDYIASGCWANTARAGAHRFAGLVMIDVVRRDPLSTVSAGTGKRRLWLVPTTKGA